MEKEFNILSTIRKVAPPQNLFDRIAAQVEKPVIQLVSPLWLKVAGAIIVCLLAMEGYLLTQPNEIVIVEDTFLTLQSNDLYDE